MLRYYSSRLPAVEINSTFYRLPTDTVLRGWNAQAPENFRFVLKAPQRITHVKRLKDVEADVDYLFRVATELGPKLGPVLFQLPPHFRKDLERLNTFLALVPMDRAAAFEFRHASWFDDEVYARLREHNRALCIAETDEEGAPEIVSCAAWGYLRLRRSDYSRAELLSWRDRVLSQQWHEAYVFFKHEDEGIGPRLAGEFIELARQA
jgi:uncharacterized protein YecE (DUF72 family)